MTAYVLLYLSNKLMKIEKRKACQAVYLLFTMSLISLIIQVGKR